TPPHSPRRPSPSPFRSSTASGSNPERSSAAFSACAARSTAWTPESPPPRLPTGVRAAARTTASDIAVHRRDQAPSQNVEGEVERSEEHTSELQSRENLV